MKQLMILGIFKIRKLVVVTNRFMNEFKSERIMRKIGYFLFATALMTLGSCSDDTVVEEKHVTPAEVGEEIRFGSSLEKAGSRTIYDDVPVGGAYRVSWVEGDQVAIYCPQAANGTLVNYAISPDKDDPTASELVTKVNQDEAGLQWGQQDDHYFYAFYPADRVTGTEDGKIRGHVPTTQNVTSWNQETENGGTTWYGKTNTEENAYMWAYGHFKRSEMGKAAIPLTFHPWMTVLEIVIQGPSSGTKTVTNVNIRAIEGQQTMLAGDFICDMTPVEENGATGTPNYEPVGNQGTVNNTISISGYNAETDEFITLGPDDKMVVRAYLLPIDEQNTVDARNIQISVATLNGAALTRTLGYSNHGSNSIQPHKVNRVTLPRLTDTGTNYWMSSLDKDIYYSELSIPGSKFSYNTSDNGAYPVYQGEDIQTQFLDGVRAFIVPTNAYEYYNRTGSIWGGGYNYTYDHDALEIASGGSNTLENTVADIVSELKTAEAELEERCNESAVIMITYNNAGARWIDPDSWGSQSGDYDNNKTAYRTWIEVVERELSRMAKDERYSAHIYVEEINANTKMSDVAGKIIFKVNYNVSNDGESMETYATVNGRCPALFSYWNGTINTVDLKWGTANPINYNSPLMHWMYQEATHISDNSGEGSATQKLNNVMTIFDNSVDAYQDNVAHDTWFMNDCGGVFNGYVTGAGDYSGSYSSGNGSEGTTEGVIALTRWMNAEVRAKLQVRDKNASLGLVFFNYADKQPNSGQEYETDELIQTVIDNNFKFNLRKEGGSTNTTSYDAAYSNGGNVWD